MLLICAGSDVAAQGVIDPRSGFVTVTTTDLILPAGAINLEISRSLHLESDSEGLLGNRWRLNWEDTLTRLGARILIHQSDGLISYVQEDHKPEYVGPSGERIVVDHRGRAIRTRPDGTRDTFSVEGRLLERDLRNGNKVTLHYEPDGRLARISGPRGHGFQFSYDAAGRLTLVETTSGAPIRYAYNKKYLTEVQVNRGPVLRYDYDKMGALIRIDDPMTGPVTFSYDSKGRVLSRRWADGSQERYEYDDENNVRRHINTAGGITTSRWSEDNRRTEITDPLGNRTTVEYGANERTITVTGPTGAVGEIKQDALGRAIAIEDAEGRTTRIEYVKDTAFPKVIARNGGDPRLFEYDDRQNLLRVTSGGKTVAAFTYYPDGLLKTVMGSGKQENTFAYHPDGSLKSETNALGATVRFEYDGRGNLIREVDPLGYERLWHYDASGRLVREIDPMGASTRFEYDAAGRLIRLTDPAGGVTSFRYDKRGRLVGETDPLNRMIRYQFYPDGQLKSITDPAGHRKQFEYDVAGNLLREINPLGGVITRMHDPLGRVMQEMDPAGGTVRFDHSPGGNEILRVDASGAATRFEYNNRDQMIAEIDSAGRVTRYDYTPEGLLSGVSRFGGPELKLDHDPAGNLTALSLGGIQLIRYEYDILGQLTKETHASGFEESYRYDATGNLVEWEDNRGGGSVAYNANGQPTAVTNSLDATYLYGYDPAGNLIRKSDPLGNTQRLRFDAAGQLTQVIEPTGDQTRYQYDPAGNLTRVLRPGGGTDTYQYDPLGNPIAFTNPLGDTARSSFDPAGKLVSTTDPKGQSTTMVYEPAGRLIEKRLADGKVIRYQYDAEGNLTEADDGVFPVRYTYGPGGEMVQIEYPAIKRVLNYEYDESNRLVTFTDSEGRMIQYRYDAYGRLAAIRVKEGEEIRFEYDAYDQPVSIVFPNGVREEWEYDSEGRPINLTYLDSSRKILAQWRYTYDDAGNMVERTDHQGHTARYRYDPSDQLVEELLDKSRTTYGYMAGGNRSLQKTASGSTQYSQDQADRLLKAGEDTLKYDANGNLVERHGPSGITRYDYDSEDRLIKVRLSNGSIVSYGYAPTGERIWRQDDHGKTYFVTDGFNVLAELDENLKLKASYLHGPGIDNPLMMVRENRAFYFHADRMGSISQVTDQEGKVAISYAYDAFGRMTEIGSLTNPFTYTAREYDKETGLYYYRARYYDPELGRFLTSDPVKGTLEAPLTLNPYTYADNNPMRYVDPLGTVSIEEYIEGLERSYSSSPVDLQNRLIKEIKDNAVRIRAVQSDPSKAQVLGSVQEIRAEQRKLQRALAEAGKQIKVSNPGPSAKQPSTPGKQSSPPVFIDPAKAVTGKVSPGRKKVREMVRKQIRGGMARRGGDWKHSIPGPKGPGGSSFVPRSRGGFFIQPASQVTLGTLAKAGVNVATIGATGLTGAMVVQSVYVTLTSETPGLTGLVEAGIWAAVIKGGAVGGSLGGIPGALIGSFLGGTAASNFGQAFIEAVLAQPGPSPYISPAGSDGPTASQPGQVTTAGTAQALLRPSATQPINVGPPPATPTGPGIGSSATFTPPTTSQPASQTTSGTPSDSPKEPTGVVEIGSTQWVINKLIEERKAEEERQAEQEAEKERQRQVLEGYRREKQRREIERQAQVGRRTEQQSLSEYLQGKRGLSEREKTRTKLARTIDEMEKEIEHHSGKKGEGRKPSSEGTGKKTQAAPTAPKETPIDLSGAWMLSWTWSVTTVDFIGRVSGGPNQWNYQGTLEGGGNAIWSPKKGSAQIQCSLRGKLDDPEDATASMSCNASFPWRAETKGKIRTTTLRDARKFTYEGKGTGTNDEGKRSSVDKLTLRPHSISSR